MPGITENGDEGAQKTREERVYDAAMEYLDGADEHGVHPTLTFDGVAFGHKVTGSAVFRKVDSIRKGRVPNKGGRPRMISEEIKKALLGEAKPNDLGKASFDDDSFSARLEQLRIEEAARLGKNTRTLPPISRTTMGRLIKEVVPELVKTTRSQNERRFESIANPLNHVSLAAMWPAVAGLGEDDEIPASRTFNFDATSIMLESHSDKATKKLRLAAGSKAELKRLGLSPSCTYTRSQGLYKRRCIELIVLTRADGVLCAVLIKVKDYAFKKTECFQVKRPPGTWYNVYVIRTPGKKTVEAETSFEDELLGSDSEDEIDMEVLNEACKDDLADESNVAAGAGSSSAGGSTSTSAAAGAGADQPAPGHPPQSAAPKPVSEQMTVARMVIDAMLESVRDALKKDMYEDLTPSQGGPGPTKEEVEEAVAKLRAILAFDGEQFQIAALTEAIESGRVTNIELVKLAAMCSFFQQPNDQMAGFRIIKHLCKDLYNKRTPPLVVCKQASKYLTKCEKLMEDVPLASRRTFMLFFEYLPSFLSVSFSRPHVSAGWHRTGLFPYNPTQMLEYWPKFRELTEESVTRLLKLLPDLTVRGRAVGYLEDKVVVQEIRACVPDVFEEGTFELGNGKRDILDYVVNRWRATWLNREGTIARRKQRADDIAAQEAAAAERKKAKGAKKRAGTAEPTATAKKGKK